MVYWIIGIGLELIAVAYLALRQDLHVVCYALESDRLPPEARMRLVVVSDLHNTIYPGSQQALAGVILGEKPDAVLVTGDFFDEHGDAQGARLLAGALQGRVACYYTPGNHEYRAPLPEATFRQLGDLGCVVLRNRAALVRLGHANVVLAGLDDPERAKIDEGYDWETALAHLGEEVAGLPGYRILLAHRPDAIDEYRQMDFDLILSGHAHGGQWRIPGWINGVYAPGQGLFPRYAGGLYLLDDLAFIVSRGLSNNTWVPRIFNPPELVVIELTGKGRQNYSKGGA